MLTPLVKTIVDAVGAVYDHLLKSAITAAAVKSGAFLPINVVMIIFSGESSKNAIIAEKENSLPGIVLHIAFNIMLSLMIYND